MVHVHYSWDHVCVSPTQCKGIKFYFAKHLARVVTPIDSVVSTVIVGQSFDQLFSVVCPLTTLIFSHWPLTAVQLLPPIEWQIADLFLHTRPSIPHCDWLLSALTVFLGVFWPLTTPFWVSLTGDHWPTAVEVVATASMGVTPLCLSWESVWAYM